MPCAPAARSRPRDSITLRKFSSDAPRNGDAREAILIRCFAQKSAAARGGPERAVAVAHEQDRPA